MYFLRLVPAWRFSRCRWPDGFVGDDDAGDVGGGSPSGPRHTAFHHGEGFAPSRSIRRFPRRGIGVQAPLKAVLVFVDQGVGLAVKLAAFRWR